MMYMCVARSPQANLARHCRPRLCACASVHAHVCMRAPPHACMHAYVLPCKQRAYSDQGLPLPAAALVAKPATAYIHGSAPPRCGQSSARKQSTMAGEWGTTQKTVSAPPTIHHVRPKFGWHRTNVPTCLETGRPELAHFSIGAQAYS